MSSNAIVNLVEKSEAIAKYAGEIAEVISMKATVQDLLKTQMQEDVHFGKIPGTGDKPTLLKPGAEMLRMVFGLKTTCTKDDIAISNEGNGHKTYEITMHISKNDQIIATGVGACSTLESKYKYRTSPTDRLVPKEYWDNRDKSLLGGEQFSVKKKDKKWVIHERIEHDNPADYYNTVKKMAKKRALADGILTATASSDLFTQDIEDLNANFKVYDHIQNEQPMKDVTPSTDEELTKSYEEVNALQKEETKEETKPQIIVDEPELPSLEHDNKDVQDTADIMYAKASLSKEDYEQLMDTDLFQDILKSLKEHDILAPIQEYSGQIREYFKKVA